MTLTNLPYPHRICGSRDLERRTPDMTDWFGEEELTGLGFGPGDADLLRRHRWKARMRERRDGRWEFHRDLLQDQAEAWGRDLKLPPKPPQRDSFETWGLCWTGLTVAAGLAFWWATTHDASQAPMNGAGVLAILSSVVMIIGLVATWFTVPTGLFSAADRQADGTAALLLRAAAVVVWIAGIAVVAAAALGVVRGVLSFVAPFVALVVVVVGVLVLAAWTLQARLSRPQAQPTTRAAVAAASDVAVLTPEPERSTRFAGFVQDVLAPVDRPTFTPGSAMDALTTTYGGVRGTAAAIARLSESKGWGSFASGHFVPAFQLVGIRPVGADGDAQLLFDPLALGVTAGDLQGYVPALLTELHVRRAIGEVARDHYTKGMSLHVSNRPADDDAPPVPRVSDDSPDEWVDDL